jgi:hypothetical protein
MELNARKRAITEVLAAYECALQTRTHLVAIAEPVKGQVRSSRGVCLNVGSPLDSRRIRCSADVVGFSARQTRLEPSVGSLANFTWGRCILFRLGS